VCGGWFRGGVVECEGWFGVGGLGGYIVVPGVLRRNSRPHQYPWRPRAVVWSRCVYPEFRVWILLCAYNSNLY